MPELPEVETTKTSLAPLLQAKVTAVDVKQARLRWAVPADLDTLTGQTLTAIKRRAKYLLLSFTTDTLIVHLGMSGSLRIVKSTDALRTHDHVLIDFTAVDGKSVQLRYHDPRRFGCVMWLTTDTEQQLLAHLAPEPLTDEFNADYFWQKIKLKKTAIKTIIMDQHHVVGVGNIYATESLFTCGIHPLTPANQLTEDQAKQLVLEMKAILARAILKGGSSLKDYVNASGEMGYFQQTLNVYGRAGKPCVTCDTALDNLKISQRASVFCPVCQPLKKEQQHTNPLDSIE